MRTWRAAVLFAVLTLLLTWPLARHPSSATWSSGPDGDLFIWTLAWDAHAFVHQPLSIFDANIYHPLRRTLAYSENLIGSALFAAPVIWLTGSPVLALNAAALVSCALCGLGAFVLARRVGLRAAGAVIAGLVFAFAPPRFFRTSQLHVGAVQWIPFALAFLHAYLDKGRARDLRLAAACFSLQALASGHGAAFLFVAMTALAVYRAVRGTAIDAARRLRDLGVTGALLLAPAVLVYLPYRAVQQETGLRRSLENWAVTPVSFLASPTHAHAWLASLAPGLRILEDASAYLFPGVLPLLLAASAIVLRPGGARRAMGGGRGPAGARRALAVLVRAAAYFLEAAVAASLVLAVAVTLTGPLRLRAGGTVVVSARSALRPWLLAAAAALARAALLGRVPFDPASRWRRSAAGVRRLGLRLRTPEPSGSVFFYGLLMLLGLWLSIGPPLGLWPLVYWLPGMSFIRVPSRFTVLAVLGLAIVAGAGMDRLLARVSSRRRTLLPAAVAVLLVAESAAAPLSLVPAHAEAPLADRWLAARPRPFVVAEVPLPDPMDASAFERRQTMYMLHAMAHWQKTVHGYSGWRAPLHERLYLAMRAFPDDASLDALSRLGVTYVVVHTELYPPGEWPLVEERLERFGARLQLEHVAGAGRVYALRPARP
ncbi:MAG TPA: hypothetical protein PLE61_09280 [Vicinamibacterales bacterium]|nr:hypothetical protein [Vicinamibacterales bacterium]HPW20993.1 hypothetical protein [Vicinamibacterales bacterium]